MVTGSTLHGGVNSDSTDSLIDFNAPEYAQTLLCEIWVEQEDNTDERNHEASLEVWTMLPRDKIHHQPNSEHQDSEDYR